MFFLNEVKETLTRFTFSKILFAPHPSGQCGGFGSVSFCWIRIRIKKWLDPETGSNDTDPTKTIDNRKYLKFVYPNLNDYSKTSDS